MVSSAYYRDQARRLRQWALRESGETSEILAARASENETLAEVLDVHPYAPQSKPSSRRPTAQQQQQTQPKNDDKKE